MHSAPASGAAGPRGGLLRSRTALARRAPARVVRIGKIRKGAVYVKAPRTSRWVQIANRALSSGTTWKYSYRPAKRGTYRFYAAYNTTIQSSVISVGVR